MSPVEALNADALDAALRDQLIGNRIVVLEETTSTNDEVFRLAATSEEGLVVFAEHQTAGRGQHGKSWESAAGKGLWFSVLLRPNLAPNETKRLTSWAAETVAATLRNQFSLPATVKAPNDVFVDMHKVAGVLLEMRAIPMSAHVGILGIGVNVNQSADDFPEDLRTRAGSVAMFVGNPIDRQALAAALLEELDRTYRAIF